MKTIISWLIFCKCFVQYLLYRLRLCRPPLIRSYYDYYDVWFSSLLGFRRRLRIVDAHHCPRSGPAVFAGNHIKLDDPLFAWSAIFRASAGRIRLRFMMRDDFFNGFPWDYQPFNITELITLSGGYGIARDNIQLSQLKPLLQVLKDGESFVMFPGRTRTRSGMIVEYRENFTEPGGVSFFLANAQRRGGGVDIPMVPMCRTFNPVTKRSAEVIGAPIVLEQGADREAQRKFDAEVILRIAALVEINMAHIVCGLIYLHCLHGRGPEVPVKMLSMTASQIILRLATGKTSQGGLPIAPEALHSGHDEVLRTIRYLAKKGMFTTTGNEITLDVCRVLSVPPLDTTYKKLNPVKFITNQVLHVPEVIEELEAASLG